MDILKIQRTPVRASFTKLANKLQKELDSEDVNIESVRIFMQQLFEKKESLNEVQEKIFALVLDDKSGESEKIYVREYDQADEYNERFIELKLRAEMLLEEKVKVELSEHPRSHETSVMEGSVKKSYRLPKLELRKFDGDLKNWLGFWGQFKQIHNDGSIVPEDKFQYLVQAIVPGSRAAILVNSYPPSAENYAKVIEQLHNRFGRSDLLVQVYVRELIGMIMKNAADGKVCDNLPTLYDKLECQLRALESLGRTTDKYTDFLCPLIESCLPEDVLRLWQRSNSHREKVEGQEEDDNPLEELMDFLKKEVNSEERIRLAKSNFGMKVETIGNQSRKGKQFSENIETCATLVNSNRNQTQPKSECIFCNKLHRSSSCFTARNMPLEERKKLVLEKQACFGCLGSGHVARYCRSNNRCVVCYRKHASLLCPDLVSIQQRKEDWAYKQKKPEVSTDLSNQTRDHVLLGTLLIKLENDSGETIIRCLLDCGSQRSYISEKLANKLNLSRLRKETMVHGLFGGTETKPLTHDVHRVYVASMDGSFRCNFEILTQHTICAAVDMLDSKEIETITKEYRLNLTEEQNGPQEVQMLIGADIFAKLLTGEIKPLGADLMAIKTKLGWTVIGKLKRLIDSQKDSTLSTLSLYVNDLSISNLWRLDLMGISDPTGSKSARERHSEILAQFMETIKVGNSGRYQVSLPWKSSHPPLPDNKVVAMRRIEKTKKKLEEDNCFQEYQRILEGWLDQGIIEQVYSENVPCCHYLPHRPVIKEGSTTRIRPVFDASSHKKGSPSLNDCLEKGLNLIEDIPNILERFRDKKLGIIADIEKAFLQLEVEPEQRDFLRFYGVDNKIYRHRRVVFGVTSSPFLLGAVIKYHLNKMRHKYSDTVQKLEKSFYVDNCVYSVANLEELKCFMTDSISIMEEGCFNLRGWESNHLTSPTPNKKEREVSVLGLIWNLGRDTLRCNIQDMTCETITKRTILSCTQKIFDPIGYTCPIILYPKIILQDLWSLKIGWDECVPEEFQVKFKNWKKQLPLIGSIEMPRCAERNEESQLHIFTDASQKAYAACVFLRTCYEESVTIRMLRAKSRVAPIEKITIPRLELLACLMGARLANSIKQALDDKEIKTFCWSDSLNALWWIKKEGAWTNFVQNRVQEIRILTLKEQWHYVPGEMNPADLPSRGCSVVRMLKEKWWEGPAWLHLSEEHWPEKKELPYPEHVENSESKSLQFCDIDKKEVEFDYQLLRYFSTYRRIVRMVAWMRRFIFNSKKTDAKLIGELSSDEYIQAEKILFRYVQRKEVVGHRRNSLAKIYKDDEDLLRIETRITEREDSHDFLYPIVLPGDHLLIRKLIEEVHKNSCHAGPQLMMGILREKFWILGLRRTIRKIIHDCMRCRRYMQKPLEAEPVSLPKNRVEDSDVFETTGVDLAGPLYVKEGKVWIVLFTCAVYRAVHLELVSSLSTAAFLQALRRFIARRGRPKVIYSDNGTNFCGTQTEFNKLDWKKITAGSDVARIQWRFNPPSAAWWGGWWERIVRIVKELLRRTLGRAHLNYEELTTVICECEAVINSRPLSYCSGDADELIPLTPALFLRNLNQGGVEDIDKVEATHLQKRIRYRQKLVQQLRQRFRREYLGELLKEKSKTSVTQSVHVGDVVIIGDDQRKRIKWPFGVIVEVYPGKDDKVRCARIRTPDGIVLRPIKRLYPMEMTSPQINKAPMESVRKPNINTEEATDESQMMTRSGRMIKPPLKLDLFNIGTY